ncbi:MAG TPA: phosphotransferase family protein [Pseudomonadales bacterium]|nr:phosphotransferase family protein [Pseudomonadales bacterium]
MYFRGHRPGLGKSSKRLLMEMQVMQVLEQHGIPVPHCYGLCPAETGLEGIVMERKPGQANLALLDNPADQHRILDAYIDALVAMHKIDVRAFDGIALTRPDNSDEIALADLPYWEASYRKQKVRPEPLLEFAIDWLKNHAPANRNKTVFLQVDSGQFIYHNKKLSALLDFELSMLGDPMADLAGLRTRNLSEPLMDLPRAFQRYEQQSGEAIDHYALDYHTVRFALMTPLPIAALCACPPPRVNLPQYLGWYYLYSMVAIQGIARIENIVLTEPELPTLPDDPHGLQPSTPFSPAYRALHQHLDALHAEAESNNRYELDVTRRTAQYLQRLDAIGADVEHANQQELAALLGTPVNNWLDSQQQLEDKILQGKIHDRTALLDYFYHSCKRHLHLLGPALRELENVSIEWGA